MGEETILGGEKRLQGQNLTNYERHEHIMRTQELLLKGYDNTRILAIINKERQDSGKRPLHRQSLYRFRKELEQEYSKDFLDMMKNQTAFIILHRRKLLELDLYKKMLHDKIAVQGGITSIKADVLNRIVVTLTNITITQSKLEKEFPLLMNLQSEKKPEEMQQIEAEIVNTLSPEMKQQYEKQRSKQMLELEQTYQKDPTGGNVNLSEHPEDTYII